MAEAETWLCSGKLPKDAKKTHVKADIIRMVKTSKPVES